MSKKIVPKSSGTGVMYQHWNFHEESPISLEIRMFNKTDRTLDNNLFFLFLSERCNEKLFK